MVADPGWESKPAAVPDLPVGEASAVVALASIRVAALAPVVADSPACQVPVEWPFGA